jgi:hypothetical protein
MNAINKLRNEKDYRVTNILHLGIKRPVQRISSEECYDKYVYECEFAEEVRIVDDIVNKVFPRSKYPTLGIYYEFEDYSNIEFKTFEIEQVAQQGGYITDIGEIVDKAREMLNDINSKLGDLVRYRSKQVHPVKYNEEEHLDIDHYGTDEGTLPHFVDDEGNVIAIEGGKVISLGKNENKDIPF